MRALSFVEKNQLIVITTAGADYTHRFHVDRKTRPVRLSCDIHPWMRAWIFVFNHPYFAVTSKRGQFNIRDIPPGAYQLQFQQADVGFTWEQKVTVSAGETKSITTVTKAEDLKVR